MLKNSSLGCAVQLGVFAVIVIGGLTIVQALLGAPGTLIEALQPPPPTPTTIVLPPVLEVINRQPKLQSTSYYLSTVAEARQTVGVLQEGEKGGLVGGGKGGGGGGLGKK